MKIFKHKNSIDWNVTNTKPKLIYGIFLLSVYILMYIGIHYSIHYKFITDKDIIGHLDILKVFLVPFAIVALQIILMIPSEQDSRKAYETIVKQGHSIDSLKKEIENLLEINSKITKQLSRIEPYHPKNNNRKRKRK